MANRSRRGLPPDVARPALARANLYAALARNFLYPTAALLDGYRQGEFLAVVKEALAELGTPVSVGLADAVAALETALATDLKQAPTLQQWADAYLFLFEHGMDVPCPLYETEYTTAHLWQQTQAMADIAGFYKAFGVHHEASGERPDHLALELDFMHLLCMKEAVALADGNAEAAAVCAEAQTKFIAEHLGCWTGVVSTLCHRNGALQTYGAVADLTDRWIGLEAVRVGVAPKRARRTQPLRKDGVGPIRRPDLAPPDEVLKGVIPTPETN